MELPYLMDSKDENIRLEKKTDPDAIQVQALRAGLKPGMRVADVCCGSGISAATLGRLTGPEGKVVGIEGSTQRIAYARQQYGNDNTCFELRDIRKDLSDLGTFDFVWVRFILEYYRQEAFELVKNISSIVAKGGIICLLDLDHNCMNHYDISPKLEQAIHAVMNILQERANFDPYAGRKLYSHLYHLGYNNLEAAVWAHHLIYGPLKQVDEYNWMKKIEVISKKMDISLPGYDSVNDFITDFKLFFSKPERFTYTPMIGCWGIKDSDP